MWTRLPHEGQVGTEGGTILMDEEYEGACRLTLEQCSQHYAITCGIYGAMVHTAFCGDDFQRVYNAMKQELQDFIDQDVSDAECSEFYEYFTSKYE